MLRCVRLSEGPRERDMDPIRHALPRSFARQRYCEFTQIMEKTTPCMCNRLIKFFCLCRHPGKDQGPVVWSSLLFVWDMLLKSGCLSMKFKLWLWWKPDCSLGKAFYSRAGLMLQLAL